MYKVAGREGYFTETEDEVLSSEQSMFGRPVRHLRREVKLISVQGERSRLETHEWSSARQFRFSSYDSGRIMPSVNRGDEENH